MTNKKSEFKASMSPKERLKKKKTMAQQKSNVSQKTDKKPGRKMPQVVGGGTSGRTTPYCKV